MKKIPTLIALLIMTILTACEQNPDIGGIETFYTRSRKKITLTCIKHSSLQINFEGKEIEIDPVGSAYRPITDYTKKPMADYILVTHDHSDHFDMTAIFLLSKKNTILLLPPNCYSRYKRGTVIKNNEEVRLDDQITVYAVPAYNTTLSHKKYHPKGKGNGYILQLDDFRIYIAGDTEVIPEMHKIKDIDLALLPCNQPYTMTIAQLRQAVKIIKPKALIPYHMALTDRDSIYRAVRDICPDVRMRMMK